MYITIQDKKYKVVGEIKDNKAIVSLGDHTKEVIKKGEFWSWVYMPFASRCGWHQGSGDR